MVWYLVRSPGERCIEVDIKEGESTCVELSEGEWIVISIFTEVAPLVTDEGRFLKASIYESQPDKVYDGRLIVGERGNVVEGFKQLFQNLCKATSIG
ncbi:hypothetical protein SUGI_0688570 [Cryptomeria japonica]|nr:hypothetical protein SUGI_0688570 [Cryptomeria japonica]